MRTTIKSLVCVLLLLPIIVKESVEAAISIEVTGDWSETTIDYTDLLAGAGSDLKNPYESAVAAVSIDILDANGNWGVSVKADTDPPDWHSNLHLHVKRTSEGTGSGSISGGDAYLEVTDTDQDFFSGSLSRSGINVQLMLTGVSIQVPPDVYSTTVYYTVLDQ